MSTPPTMTKKLAICRDASVPARARAETAAFVAAEVPLDAIPVFEQIIQEADYGREKKKEEEEEERSPLVRAVFMRPCDIAGKLYAAVAAPQGETYLPCKEAPLEGREMGDPVLIDTKSSR